jgi:type III secretion protein T
MFVAEFGLGLVSRFAPQLNVFIVAVPIKAGVAVLVLIFYLPLIAEYMRDNASVFSHLYTETERLFGQ